MCAGSETLLITALNINFFAREWRGGKEKFSPYLILLSTGIEGVMSIIGGIVDSVVVEVVVVGSGFELTKPPMPAAATLSFDTADVNFLASMGFSDLLKAPAVCRREK